ncbi:MAG: hypothetical protein ACIRZV_03730 [Limosilactobacillus mucosae]
MRLITISDQHGHALRYDYHTALKGIKSLYNYELTQGDKRLNDIGKTMLPLLGHDLNNIKACYWLVLSLNNGVYQKVMDLLALGDTFETLSAVERLDAIYRNTKSKKRTVSGNSLAALHLTQHQSIAVQRANDFLANTDETNIAANLLRAMVSGQLDKIKTPLPVGNGEKLKA